VSAFLAWIRSPCLRHCVHGASIGGGGGGSPQDETADRFDAVVLAMPPRDVLRVQGDGTWRRALDIVRPQLSKVQWTARFSLALFFAPADATAAEVFVAAAEAAFASSEVGSHAVLDVVMRQQPPPPADSPGSSGAGSVTALVLQSTPGFWARHSRVHAGGGRGEPTVSILESVHIG
jgi:hypothetical protein